MSTPIPKRMIHLLLAAIITVSLAFQVLTKPELIRQKVQEKVDTYIRVRQAECQQQVLEKAALIVDSMLIEKVRMNKDTLHKPPRPIKPEAPDKQPPRDSMPIRPLFNGDSSAVD